ncbi:MAG: hypothetical protein ABW098_06630 [Candidatus Thiodiazotropha sp.]
MKNCTVIKDYGLRKQRVYRSAILFSGASFLLFVLSVQVSVAAIAYFDDFEDLNHDGWNVTATGGGSTGVTFVNESNWAYAYNAHSGKLSLSNEFDYQPDSILSFEMQALANAGRGNYGETFHSASGVTVLFENRFNVALGDVSFVYATSSSLLPSNSFAIGNTPDLFEAPMSQWAELALLDSSSVISDISLQFWAIGHAAQVPRGSAGPAQILFDNVTIQPVPIPAASLLFASALGLFGLGFKRW